MIRSEILVPLLNANEPEARVVGIHARDGQSVKKGDLLFTLETTKAATDIHSPEKGYLRLLASEGDLLAVGERLAVITGTPEEGIEIDRERVRTPASVGGLRITQPARALAKLLKVDLASLPTDRLVTEKVVRQVAGSGESLHLRLPASEKPYLSIFGAGGHAKTLMEMVRTLGGYEIAGLVDDSIPAGSMVLGIPVLGTRSVLPQLIEQGVKLAANGVGGILDIRVRVRIFQLLMENGFALPGLVHPRATLEPSATVGEGVQVFANAYVGSAAVLQPMCMVNTNAVVSHDCVVGSYSHIAPGALLAGQVQVGERSLIGMGVTTAVGVRIGSGVRIGNGAILLADVPDKMVIQAGRYWVGKADTP